MANTCLLNKHTYDYYLHRCSGKYVFTIMYEDHTGVHLTAYNMHWQQIFNITHYKTGTYRIFSQQSSHMIVRLVTD